MTDRAERFDTNPAAKAVVRAAFPERAKKSRRIRVRFTDEMRLSSTYWSGGTKYSYSAVRVPDLAVVAIPDEDPAVYGGNPNQRVRIPKDVVLVEHCIFCGKDVGFTLIVNPENGPKLLG